MNLNLIKPLAVFDLETTGINVATDRIVEISILKVNPDYSKETLTMRINPEMPIPLETSEIHGIYDIDVTNAPTFAESAAKTGGTNKIDAVAPVCFTASFTVLKTGNPKCF